MALIECQTCHNRVDRYYVSPRSGGKYCCDCWDNIHTPKSERWLEGIFVVDKFTNAQIEPFVHVSTGGTVPIRIDSGRMTGHQKDDQASMFGYLQCSACKAWASGGEYAGNDWLCDSCLADDTDPNCDALPAKVHFSAKPKGNKVAIAYFDFMMSEIDSDWPSPTKNPPICSECGGVEWVAPIMSPKQIKQLASECGVGKLKIRYWGDAVKCAKVVV